MTVLAYYARLYVSDMDRTLHVLQALTGTRPSWRAGFESLELAGIGRHLVIAGTQTALAPFRDTHATVVVDDLAQVQQLLADHRASITHGPFEAPNGPGLTARHADGGVVEYVQWNARLRHEAIDNAPGTGPDAPVVSAFGRLYVSELDQALPLLRDLTGSEPAIRFRHDDLELATIGGFLVIAGAPQSLVPYRPNQVTHIVRDLEETIGLVDTHGGTILDGPNSVATGHNLTYALPGGARIESVKPADGVDVTGATA